MKTFAIKFLVIISFFLSTINGSTSSASLTSDTLTFDKMFRAVVGNDATYVCREFKNGKKNIKRALYTLPDGTLEVSAVKESKAKKTGEYYEFNRRYVADKKLSQVGVFDAKSRLMHTSFMKGGKPVDSGSGYSQMVYSYSPGEITCSYYDASGNPVKCSKGYAVSRKTVEFNLSDGVSKQSIMLSESFYGKDGEPATCSEGYHKMLIVADNEQLRIGFRSKGNTRVDINGYSDIVLKPDFVYISDESVCMTPIQLIFALSGSDCKGASELLSMATTCGSEIDILNRCYKSSLRISMHPVISSLVIMSDYDINNDVMQRLIKSNSSDSDSSNPSSPEVLKAGFIMKMFSVYRTMNKHLTDGSIGTFMPEWTVTRFNSKRESVPVEGKNTRSFTFNVLKFEFNEI